MLNHGPDSATDKTNEAIARFALRRHLRGISQLLDNGMQDKAKRLLGEIITKHPEFGADGSAIDSMSRRDLEHLTSALLKQVDKLPIRVEEAAPLPDLGPLIVPKQQFAPDVNDLDRALGESPFFHEKALRRCNDLREKAGVKPSQEIDLRLLAQENWAIEAAGMVKADPKAEDATAPAVKAVTLVEHEGAIYSISLMVRKKPTVDRFLKVQEDMTPSFSENCTIYLCVTDIANKRQFSFRQLDQFSQAPTESTVAQTIAEKLYAQSEEQIPPTGLLRSIRGDEDFLTALEAATLGDILKQMGVAELGGLLASGSNSQNYKAWEFVS